MRYPLGSRTERKAAIDGQGMSRRYRAGKAKSAYGSQIDSLGCGQRHVPLE